MPSADPASPDTGGYDEPGSRTGFAWLRTWLASLAVAALMMRGLLIAEAGWLPVAGVVVCLVGLAAVGLLRSGRLRPRTSPAAPWQLIVATTVICLVLAGLGVAGAVLQLGG